MIDRDDDAEDVGAEEDCTAIVADLSHHVFEKFGGFWIKTDERFVHHDEFWVMNPSTDDGEFLLHTM